MPEGSILVCYRVADLLSPKVGSVRDHCCIDCGEEVWVMPKNLGYGLPLVCYPCSLLRIKKEMEAGEVVKVFPASELSERN